MSTIQDSVEREDNHRHFLESTREHVLMLTTHGVHQWQVMPGLPDTGGQNVFVNQFSQALVDQGYRVTIANRGGYPHPLTHEFQQGLHYKDAYQRLVYLEDGHASFVRKEDMADHVQRLAQSLDEILGHEGDSLRVIISHYWDAARVGEIYNNAREHPLLHVWVPHSLGMVKSKNVSAQQRKQLRIEERIAIERQVLSKIPVAAATSSRIMASLIEDYGFAGRIPFLPPCIDPLRFHPAQIEADDEIWNFLAELGHVDQARLREGRIISEISRTDRTKRKDILLRALGKVLDVEPEVFLVLSIDPRSEQLADALRALIAELGIGGNVIVVGSVWDRLPKIYAISDIYCTPSVMEGFGMSAQEAAATGVPVVASELVPFVVEYLMGEQFEEIACADCAQPIRVGRGAITVTADDINGFAQAMLRLLQNPQLSKALGQSALASTVPYFTWPNRTGAFLHEIGLSVGRDG